MGESITKSVILIATFFIFTPIALATSLYSLIAISGQKPQPKVASYESYGNVFVNPKSGVSVYASLPNSLPSIESEVKVEDARAYIIRDYLDSYNSPLEPYSKDIVFFSDKYGVDFRLTTAIAQQESNLCKKIPAETYNCWGWGIHSRGTLAFQNYLQGIEEVTRGLREEYVDEDLTTVEEIMTKYTPLSNGSWAEGVNKFLLEME